VTGENNYLHQLFPIIFYEKIFAALIKTFKDQKSILLK